MRISLNNEYGNRHLKLSSQKDSAPNVKIYSTTGLHWVPHRLEDTTRKPEPDENGYYHTIARSCSTFELEGSTRSGCRFCTFLLQSFKDNKTLDIFRKIEARLDHLKENALLSLSIQHDGTSPSQNVWLNLPGKVSTSRQLVATEGVIATLESYFHPASGASCFTDIMVQSC